MEDRNYNCVVQIEDTSFHISLNNTFFDTYGDAVPLHNHNCYELHAVKSGSYQFNIDGRSLTLGAEDCCIIAPTVYHTHRILPNTDPKQYCFRFECTPHNAKLLEYLLRIDKFLLFSPDMQATKLLAAAEREFAQKRIGYTANVNSIFSQLLVAIVRELYDADSSTAENYLQNTDEMRAMEIDAFFAHHYMEDVRAEALAQLLNLSVRQLDRIMRRLYGMSFRQKLVDMRMFVAKERLLDSDLTVQRIAELVGYNNISYFNAAFKEATSKTPEQYRKSEKS